jgi:hypothetical protein
MKSQAPWLLSIEDCLVARSAFPQSAEDIGRRGTLSTDQGLVRAGLGTVGKVGRDSARSIHVGQRRPENDDSLLVGDGDRFSADRMIPAQLSRNSDRVSACLRYQLKILAGFICDDVAIRQMENTVAFAAFKRSSCAQSYGSARTLQRSHRPEP